VTLLVVGLTVFLGTHLIGALAPAWRERVRARIGAGAWRAIYSVVSLLALAAIIKGFTQARANPVILYIPPEWLRHVTLLLMLPVFPLLFAAYLPGRIKTTMKHPMLVAVKLWAFAHLLANGMLADVVLFGAFLAWAVIDRISLKRRPPQAPPSAPAGRWNDAIAIVLGVALYALTVMWLHYQLFGVSPLGG
jgi:uncharacterized membrane protein